MKLIEKFPYPELPSETTERGRFYVTPMGPAPSVTTILSKLPNPGLDEWRERVGVEEADRVSAEAATIGTHMHDYLEKIILGEPLERPQNDLQKQAYGLANNIRLFGLRRVSEVWGCEKTLHFGNLYAGRCDLIGVHDGIPSIVDFKNSSRLKQEHWIGGYFKQTVAYAEAHNDMFGTDIRRAVVFVGVRRRENSAPDFQKFVIEGEDFDRYHGEWCDAVESFYGA